MQEQLSTTKRQLELALAGKEVDLKEMEAHYEEGRLREHQRTAQQ